MHPMQWTLLILNVAGGVAVLGSYAQGLAAHPGMGMALWGAIPESWRPGYGISMLLAAAGYLAFATCAIFRADPGSTRLAGGLAYGWLLLPFLLILVPSAIWMPLTWRFIEGGGEGTWLAIRVVLALVGLGALLMVVLLAGMEPRPGGAHFGLALAGAVVFLIHCGVLDALLWPSRFRG